MRRVGRALRLPDLAKDHPGISSGIAGALVEAADVCFQSQGHSPGVELAALRSKEIPSSIEPAEVETLAFAVEWPASEENVFAAWDDPGPATEWGATAVAIQLARELVDRVVIRRARRSSCGPEPTGFDYWLGPNKGSEDGLQGKTRLEVSGIRNGARSKIEQRARERRRQIRQSDASLLPGLVIVVEFGKPVARVIQI